MLRGNAFSNKVVSMKERKRQIRGHESSHGPRLIASPIARERYNNTGASIVLSPIKSFNYAARRSPFDRSSNSLCSESGQCNSCPRNFPIISFSASLRVATREKLDVFRCDARARVTGKLLLASFQLTKALAGYPNIEVLVTAWIVIQGTVDRFNTWIWIWFDIRVFRYPGFFRDYSNMKNFYLNSDQREQERNLFDIAD